MIKNNYGKTNEIVTALGFGGMRFTPEMTEEDAVRVIHYANEKGITYFDTAPNYCEDKSEDYFGAALGSMPTDNWTIATKGFNTKTKDELNESLEKSLTRLKVDSIDFYFLWCVVTLEQYEQAKMPGRSLEALMEAKRQGLIKHIGVSTHMYSEGIKKIVDDDIFEFIMVPYNALNFSEREEGLRYAKDHNLGTAVMNPLYGGIIPENRDSIKIYPNSKNDAVYDAMNFCLSSPYVDVTLSGMKAESEVDENIKLATGFEKVDVNELDRRQAEIKSAFGDMCTSCGYCMEGCPEKIGIKSYMEVYNTYILSKDEKKTKDRHYWFSNFGPLAAYKTKAGDCTNCGACESSCTQYLKITDRLNWISEKFEQETEKTESA